MALARALAIQPDVLLLDEPLSNLDAKLREEMRVEIRQLQRQLGMTTIMVTHDQEEALTVADRLVVMAEGEIRQVGSQRDLYERPADRFVAGFVGRSTFLPGRSSRRAAFETAGGLAIACREAPRHRPGDAGAAAGAHSAGAAADAANRLTGEIEFVSYLGPLLELHVRLSAADRLVVQLPNHAGCVPGARRNAHAGLAARNRHDLPLTG